MELYLWIDLSGPGCPDPAPSLQLLIVILHVLLGHGAGGHGEYQQLVVVQGEVL